MWSDPDCKQIFCVRFTCVSLSRWCFWQMFRNIVVSSARKTIPRNRLCDVLKSAAYSFLTGPVSYYFTLANATQFYSSRGDTMLVFHYFTLIQLKPDYFTRQRETFTVKEL